MNKTTLALFTSLLLLGAACASQTSVESGDAPAVGQVAEPGRATPAEAAAGEDAASTDTEAAEAVEIGDETDEPAPPTSASISSDNPNDWCAVAGQVENSFNVDGLMDPATIEEALTASTALINQAVEIAPPAIAADVEAAAQATTAMIGLLDGADWDFLAVDFEQFEGIASGMEDAGYNIEKYNFEVCGVGQDPDDFLESGIEGLDEDIELDELLDSDVARDVMAQTLSGFGLEEADAACVVEAWSANGAIDDPTGMITAMQECGVPLSTIVGG